jgi:hypothetical protein
MNFEPDHVRKFALTAQAVVCSANTYILVALDPSVSAPLALGDTLVVELDGWKPRRSITFSRGLSDREVFVALVDRMGDGTVLEDLTALSKAILQFEATAPFKVG